MLFRRTSVAFIFQSFGLIPILSAAENAAYRSASPACRSPSASNASRPC